MKVLIPAAGLSERFVREGYALPKPLIEVEGMPMIQHTIENFSPDDDFVFGINRDHAETTDILEVLSRIDPKSTLVSLPYQERGPVAVVEALLDYVDDDDEVIVNYCDFTWVWDYPAFERDVIDSGCDGAVVCYRHFHPHLLGPTTYATLLVEDGWMQEIKEKHSFTGNKETDWTSSGTYYFRRGALLKEYCRRLLDSPSHQIAGEYYVSQIFELMHEAGLRIRVPEIPFFAQWGTPQDFRAYLDWSAYFRHPRDGHEPRSEDPERVRDYWHRFFGQAAFHPHGAPARSQTPGGSRGPGA